MMIIKGGKNECNTKNLFNVEYGKRALRKREPKNLSAH